MPWRGAQHEDDFPSLGWSLLDWFEVLPSPRDPAESLRFTDEQAMQIVEWFRIDPIANSFVSRRGYSRRSKGWGKSPVEAAKTIAELVGPVRFAGWDADGEPVGRPWGGPGDPSPWVQVAAVSEDQTDNTWSVIYTFLTENDGAAADELKIDAGLTRCYLRDRPGAKLEPVTAAAGSREGQPITYAALDETHLWTLRNGGVKLARTLRRNAAKMGGRTYETTNSFQRGEGSVAEGSFKAVQSGSPGIFADEVEAPTQINGSDVDVEASDEVLRGALAVAYGGSSWVDLERLISEVRDPDSPWSDSARFFFNWNQDKVDEDDHGPIDLNLWKSDALTDANSMPVAAGVRWALDVAHDRSWSTFGLAGARSDGLVHVELTESRPGTPWVAARAKEIQDKLGGLALTVGQSTPAQSLIPDLIAAGVVIDEMGPRDQALAMIAFIDATQGAAPKIRHRGEPALSRAIKGARTKSTEYGETLTRRSSVGDVSPFSAAFMAFGRLGIDAVPPPPVPMFAVTN
jgi:hypothetical protein